MLDERGGAALPVCSIQAAGGLRAMPAACRTFPRSVVARPRGLEVAFTLACPTVATTAIHASPERCALAETRPEAWPYPATREVGRVVRWTSRGDRKPLAALDTLRGRWWERIASGTPLGEVLNAMLAAPLDPDAGPLSGRPAERTSVAFDSRGVRHLLDALSRVPRSGARWKASRRDLARTVTATPSAPELAASVAAHGPSLGLALALRVQHAGIHDGGAVEDGIRGAARFVRRTAWLAGCLEALAPDVPRRLIARDALVAAAALPA